jgi:hypothetical protein
MRIRIELERKIKDEYHLWAKIQIYTELKRIRW